MPEAGRDRGRGERLHWTARLVGGRRMLWLGALAAVIMCGAAAVTSWSMYDRTVGSQAMHLRDAATLLAEHTARSVEQVGRMMLEVIDATRPHLGGGRSTADASAADRVRSIATAVPQVAGLVVLDAAGGIWLDTLPAGLPPAVVGRILEEHRAAGSGRLHVDLPVRDTPNGTWLPISRRIEDPAGRFSGVVVSALLTGDLERVFAMLERSEATAVALIRDDGILLAGHGTGAEGVGNLAVRHADWARGVVAGKSMTTTNVVGGRLEGINALARVPGLPLALAVAVSSETVLHEWSNHSVLVATGALLAVALLLLAAAMLAREIRAAERLQVRVREGEARLEAIIQSAMDAVITIDDRQRIVLFNRAAELVFGLASSEAIGSTLDRLIPARFREAHGHHLQSFGATGQTTRRMGGVTVLYGLRANGAEFPIDASISQVMLAGRRYYTVILRDITARLAAEEEIARSHRELAELSRAAQEALEEERRRVARELHDELGQALTAVKMDLQEAESLIPPGAEELARRCQTIRHLVDDTVAATRRIASDLRPLMLDDLGLGAAIDWLVHGFAKRSGVAVTLKVADEVAEIGEPAASAVFRIVQESITNVARHANATRVDVRVAREGGFVTLRVQDDGRGIGDADLAKRGSFGLRGIRERARLLGGEAAIERLGSGGTVVTARIPIDAASFREAS